MGNKTKRLGEGLQRIEPKSALLQTEARGPGFQKRTHLKIGSSCSNARCLPFTSCAVGSSKVSALPWNEAEVDLDRLGVPSGVKGQVEWLGGDEKREGAN